MKIFFLFSLCLTLMVESINGKNDSITKAQRFYIDYCSHPDCPLMQQHTLCATQKKWNRRLIASGLTPWMRQQLQALHNRHRDTVALGLETGHPSAANMRKMYWDTELEAAAEGWVRQCRSRHDECRNTLRFPVAQNIDVRPVVQWMTQAQLLQDAVAAWFSGARTMPPERVTAFRLAGCERASGCDANRYSSAVWGNTWRIGCSQALCTLRRPPCALYRRRRQLNNFRKYSPSVTPFTRTTVSERMLLLRTNFLTSKNYNFVARSKDRSGAAVRRGKTNKRKRLEPVILAYTVCNYGPAGNIEGLPMYAVGKACTQCPAGTECIDPTHRALCALINDPESP